MILNARTGVNMLNTAATQKCFFTLLVCDQAKDSESEGYFLPEDLLNDRDVEGYGCRSSSNEQNRNSPNCCKGGTDSDWEKDSGIECPTNVDDLDSGIECPTNVDDLDSAIECPTNVSNLDFRIECPTNEDDFLQPDKVVVENIIRQVEYYFSNANLLKDPFLLKHVRRNKQGYVSLKLIASFRKVKSFTKNWRVVAHSLRYSKDLEINEEGTKVRRKDPLPHYDETPPSRTVIAFKFPFEKPTVEKIAELFSEYGIITLIRILHPSKAIPSDIKTFLYKHSEIGSSVCALVEFENRESACRASNEFFSKSSDWRSMQVIPLVSADENKNKENELKKRKKGKRQAHVGQLRKGGTPIGNGCSIEGQSRIESNRLSASPKPPSTCEKWNQGPNSCCNSFTRNPRVSKRPITSQNTSNPLDCPTSNSHSDSLKPMSNPWVQRRLTQGRERGYSIPTHNSRLLIPAGVIRFPKGPDGTTGFNWSLLKLRTQSAPV
ncbi:la-related protein 6-like [Tachypleus tridentatus]|uniref:la-related protein 6-like n=1 Tax=Tachypleus tridentatus TaxID=6853 RepID=UPI003FD29C0A